MFFLGRLVGLPPCSLIFVSCVASIVKGSSNCGEVCCIRCKSVGLQSSQSHINNVRECVAFSILVVLFVQTCVKSFSVRRPILAIHTIFEEPCKFDFFRDKIWKSIHSYTTKRVERSTASPEHNQYYLYSTSNNRMAGLGRRTHYRKHLTDSVLYDLPEPKEDERIAKVVATRGGNQFDIILASEASSSEGNRSGLAILPTKFHKLVWVKRNDYVIVQTGIDKPPDEEAEGEAAEDQIAEASTSDDPNESGIRFIINHILYKDQVKHLLSKGLWPKHDPEFSSETTGNSSSEPEPSNDDGIVYNTEDNYDDGIVYTEYDMNNDDDLFVNTNRIARLEIQDSESEEESSDEED